MPSAAEFRVIKGWRMGANKVIAACALALSSTFSSGTAGYANWSNGILYIGQDTLFTVPELNYSFHGCKMFVDDKYVLMTAGNISALYYDKSRHRVAPTPDYFANEANEILKSPGNSDIVNAKLIEAAKNAFYQTMLRSKPKDRQQLFTNRNFAGTLFWFEGPKPMVRSFFVVPTFHDDSLSFSVQNRHPREIKRPWLAGDHTQHKAIDDEAFFKFLTEISNPLDGTNAILSKEFHLSKESVAPPFTIFRLSPTGGSSWVGDAAICADHSHLTPNH